MSWLYFQTWLWYLIAFAVGVVLAWAFLVLPQQRRLRALQAITGTDVDRDLYADSRAAAASGAALFDPGRAGDPVTDQIPTVDAGPDALATTELPVQQPVDETATSEIPVVSEPVADPAAGSTATGPLTLVTADAGAKAAIAREPGGAGGPATAVAPDIADGQVATGPADPVAEGGPQPTADPAAGATPEGSSKPAEGATGPEHAETASAETAHADTARAEQDQAEAAQHESGHTETTHIETTHIETTRPETAQTETAQTETAQTETAQTERDQADSTQADSTQAESSQAGSAQAVSESTNPQHADGDQATPAAPPAAAPAMATNGNGHGEPAAAFTAGNYPGSALPLPDGSAPTPDFTIKGNADSMLFHTPDSPYFGRTKAEVWFSNSQDAEAAGFTSWTRNH